MCFRQTDYICKVQILKTSKARENILARIRRSLSEESVPMPFPEAEKEIQRIYSVPSDTPEETFAEAFIALGGKFVFCDSEEQMVHDIFMLYESRGWEQMLCAEDSLSAAFYHQKLNIVAPADGGSDGADACITGCEAVVARTGSFLFSSRQHMGRTAPVFYPVHIVVAYINQVVNDIDDAFARLKKRYGNDLPSMINLNTGPSRTADIEKTLVVGVHGPGEVFCFLINKENRAFY